MRDVGGVEPRLRILEAPEIAWLDPSGEEMSAEAWNVGYARCLGVQLFGGAIDVDEHGEDVVGDTMLLLFNADHAVTIPFVLPPPGGDNPWELVFDTARTELDATAQLGEKYDVEPCSMVVFRAAVEKETDEE